MRPHMEDALTKSHAPARVTMTAGVSEMTRTSLARTEVVPRHPEPTRHKVTRRLTSKVVRVVFDESARTP
jgi:hypothetical protein